MNKTRVTPKDFFLWAGAMLALYVGIFNYIALLWNYIDYTFPNPLSYYASDPYQSGISWEMASLIVLTPVFLILMWVIRRSIQSDPSRRDIWIRRWALFLTLFIAGVSIIVDLISVLYAFLNGTDITEQFLLKALVVVLVAAIAFMHFSADLWNYWQIYPMRNRSVGVGIFVLVIVTIISGFFIVGTPQQARLYLFDDQKVEDLVSIQSQILSYWQQEGKLPASLADLNDSINGFTVPTDEQTGASYTYTITGTTSFQLCANFNVSTQPYSPTLTENEPAMPEPAGAVGSNMQSDSWYHGPGTFCFSRTIDPSRYPPAKAQ